MQPHLRQSIHAFVVGLSICAASLYVAAAAQSPSPGVPVDPSKVLARRIAALRQDWVQDLHDKQLDQAMALYQTDAVFYSPGGSPTRGQPAIRTLFETVMKTYDSDIQLTSTGLAVSGDLAFDSGDYDETLILRSTKVRSVIHGSYLMVLERGKDQRWRIAQHMWTQREPAKP